MHISILLVVFVGQFSGITTDFVCRHMPDANWFEYKSKEREDVAEKVSALEEQVRQLQIIVTSKTLLEASRKFPNIPTDCGEIYDNGSKQSRVYLISPDGRCPFQVYCDMTNGGWTVIQKRVDGTINFYRTWDEYVEGFGDIEGEYWLGLEKIHRLTKDGYELFFDIGNHDGTIDYLHYKSFAVDGATTLYKLYVDAFGYEGSINELFSFHSGQKFSTFDRDNDVHSTNCAEKHGGGGGWWFKDCYRLGLLNGVFGKIKSGGVGYWDSKFTPIKNVTVKVKQPNGYC